MNQEVLFSKKIHWRAFSHYISFGKFKLLENFQSQKPILEKTFSAQNSFLQGNQLFILALYFCLLFNITESFRVKYWVWFSAKYSFVLLGFSRNHGAVQWWTQTALYRAHASMCIQRVLSFGMNSWHPDLLPSWIEEDQNDVQCVSKNVLLHCLWIQSQITWS